MSYQPYPDGRSNVVIRHVAGASAIEELPTEHRFRVFRCKLREQADDAYHTAAEALRALVLEIGCASERSAQEARRLAELKDRAMVDELARRLIEEPEERLRYLTVSRMSQRVRMVQDRLAAMINLGGRAAIEA